ncbi:hypothetical protein WDU94_007468 [Cyamophila willieti]
MYETKIDVNQLEVDPPPPYEEVKKSLDKPQDTPAALPSSRSRLPSGNNVTLVTVTSPRTVELKFVDRFDYKMTKWLLLLSVACMALVIVSARPNSGTPDENEARLAVRPSSSTPDKDESRRVARKLAIRPDNEEERLARQVSDATVAQVAAAASPIDAPAVPSGPAAAQPASDTQASPATPDEDEDDDDEDDDDDVGIDDIADDDDDDEEEDDENETSADDEEDDEEDDDYFERFFDDILGGNYQDIFTLTNPPELGPTIINPDFRKKSIRFPKPNDLPQQQHANPLPLDWRHFN